MGHGSGFLSFSLFLFPAELTVVVRVGYNDPEAHYQVR
jgi:hypothetical protein